jgi:signal transduction histidine kinase
MVAGGVAVRVRSARTGCVPLMLLTGATWFAGDVWSRLLYLHRGPLVHLLLAYPAGRVRTMPVALVIALSYADGLLPVVARADWPTIALAAALVGAAAWRHRTAPAAERRPRTVALATAVAIGGTLATAAVSRLAGDAGSEAALWAYLIAVTGTGFALTGDLLFGRWGREQVRELILDIGDDPRALRAALARTLEDPTLELGYRTASGDGWADEQGRQIVLPAAGARRQVTFVPAGAPMAVLVHDPHSLDDAGLAEAVASAVHLAARTTEAQEQVLARMREISRSTRRLVQAADEERRVLAREVHAGPERELRTLAGRVARLAATRDGEAGADLRRLASELDSARQDLRRFAHGVHPRALTERGLRAALTQLTAATATPVELAVVDGRFPAAVEAAAFFVCAEGLANVGKHAGAGSARIHVEVEGGALVVQVTDDGRGGVEAGRGSGLRGLADRVQALGGTLAIDSPAGAGTRLLARLPIAAANDR